MTHGARARDPKAALIYARSAFTGHSGIKCPQISGIKMAKFIHLPAAGQPIYGTYTRRRAQPL